VEEVKEPRFYQAILGIFVLVLLFLYFFTLKRPDFRKKLYHKAQFIFAGGVTLAIWELFTTKSAIFPLPYFPGMSGIFSVMYDDRLLLLRSTLYSMRLFFVGMVTGTVLGLVTGVLIGWNRQWDYWLSPIIRVTGIIPAVAWLPVALAILPTSFITGIFLIFISSWFPVSSMMAAGIIATPKSFFDVAKTLGADNRFLLVRIAIPHAMPSMFTGIMTATAFSFTTLIVSEMVGAKAGLGFYINWAKGWGAYSKVYAAIIIIAVEFALILTLIGAIRSYVLRWQRGILK
jgi:NitT/TauT family transport system permease protein